MESCSRFLQLVSDELTNVNNPFTVFRFEYTAPSKELSMKSYECDFSFLPGWYIAEMRSTPETSFQAIDKMLENCFCAFLLITAIPFIDRRIDKIIIQDYFKLICDELRIPCTRDTIDRDFDGFHRLNENDVIVRLRNFELKREIMREYSQRSSFVIRYWRGSAVIVIKDQNAASNHRHNDVEFLPTTGDDDASIVSIKEKVKAFGAKLLVMLRIICSGNDPILMKTVLMVGEILLCFLLRKFLVLISTFLLVFYFFRTLFRIPRLNRAIVSIIAAVNDFYEKYFYHVLILLIFLSL